MLTGIIPYLLKCFERKKVASYGKERRTLFSTANKKVLTLTNVI